MTSSEAMYALIASKPYIDLNHFPYFLKRAIDECPGIKTKPSHERKIHSKTRMQKQQHFKRPKLLIFSRYLLRSQDRGFVDLKGMKRLGSMPVIRRRLQECSWSRQLRKSPSMPCSLSEVAEFRPWPIKTTDRPSIGNSNRKRDLDLKKSAVEFDCCRRRIRWRKRSGDLGRGFFGIDMDLNWGESW